ncbi:MAG: hypothetical protein LBU00_03650 [Treponema sp.]|jgi:hypothetical protein|nr:hypothetical protein [Treponema sp.]
MAIMVYTCGGKRFPSLAPTTFVPLYTGYKNVVNSRDVRRNKKGVTGHIGNTFEKSCKKHIDKVKSTMYYNFKGHRAKIN